MAFVFPTLYKLTSTGAIQQWTITVDANRMITVYGQVDGKLQETEDLIKEGKNIGKTNETTPNEQAKSEAQSKWEKQIKKGYVEDIARAEKGKNDFEGGFSPMLAHKFSEQDDKISFPAYVQPKLDGHRCVAVIEDGVCTLWSRTRKPITSVPHIVAELEELYPSGSHQIDGELYNHAYKTKFEEITSLIRQEVPATNHTEVQYHVYDTNLPLPFSERFEKLYGRFHGFEKSTRLLTYLKLVSTDVAKDEAELMQVYKTFVNQGYEGAMVRNANGLYIGKRSYDLQKLKEFDDDEWPIIDIEEGRGKLMGHAAKFICRMQNGKTFGAKMKGDTSRLKEFYEDHSLWKGKTLTVRYQGFTGANGVPRFPVGIRFKEDV